MLEDLRPASKVPACGVRSVLAELDTKDAELLRGYLADIQTWASESLSNALRTKNILLSGKLITRHRKGECSCLRTLK